MELKRRLLLIILLIIIPVLIYYPILGHDFLYFWDDQWVVMNHYTSGGLTFQNIAAIFSDFYHGQYAPFNEMSYLLLYQLDGYNPFWYHLLSLVWHVANVLLIYHFLNMLLSMHYKERSDKSQIIAFIAALLLAVHPVNTEPVSWVSASKILIYSFFYLWCLLFYLKFLEKKKLRYYVLLLVFFCFSFWGKEQAVTLPLGLLLIDWFLGRQLQDKTVWIEKFPVFCLALIFGLITILSQGNGGDAPVYPFFERIFLACYTLFEYLIKSILPIKLSYIYPFPYQPQDGMTLYLWIYPFIILFLFYCLYLARKNKVVAFSAIFFLIHLIVALHIIPISRFAIVADRYAYLSLVGISLYISYLLVSLCYKYKMSLSMKKLTCGLFIIYIICLGTYSHLYTKEWENTDTLKKHLREVLDKRTMENSEK